MKRSIATAPLSPRLDGRWSVGSGGGDAMLVVAKSITVVNRAMCPAKPRSRAQGSSFIVVAPGAEM